MFRKIRKDRDQQFTNVNQGDSRIKTPILNKGGSLNLRVSSLGYRASPGEEALHLSLDNDPKEEKEERGKKRIVTVREN